MGINQNGWRTAPLSESEQAELERQIELEQEREIELKKNRRLCQQTEA